MQADSVGMNGNFELSNGSMYYTLVWACGLQIPIKIIDDSWMICFLYDERWDFPEFTIMIIDGLIYLLKMVIGHRFFIAIL